MKFKSLSIDFGEQLLVDGPQLHDLLLLLRDGLGQRVYDLVQTHALAPFLPASVLQQHFQVCQLEL